MKGPAYIVLPVQVLAVAAWLCGCVLAPSGWLKVLAVLAWPYAWYLLAERLMHAGGML